MNLESVGFSYTDPQADRALFAKSDPPPNGGEGGNPPPNGGGSAPERAPDEGGNPPPNGKTEE